MNSYLAVDIGASSGRLIVSYLESGKMVLKEVHRFPNGMVHKNGHLVWEIDRIFQEILTGMKKCKEMGFTPKSIGVDTWAVDFVLLDEEDRMISEPVGYRDTRTIGMDDEVYKVIPEDALYERTGIQKQLFNTIYQLMAVKTKEPEILKKAKTLLMIPDYLHFLLSGKKSAEYTNASTTQLLNPIKKDWDHDLLLQLGIKPSLFQNISLPGTVLGPLKPEVSALVGFTCDVVIPATHDTGAAVMAVPTAEKNVLYISSGTWSLMGTELENAICTKKSKEYNFTNEGGYHYSVRYLKNIMGLWMINSVKKELAPEKSFAEICDAASKETISSLVDANDARFLAPESMYREVQLACKETGQTVPETISQISAVIYNSLAACYKKTLHEMEEMTEKKYEKIHVIGGGANASYLNELTANECQIPVFAGPTEATAIGNIVSQMIASKELRDLKEARKVIYHSFDIQTYEPSYKSK